MKYLDTCKSYEIIPDFIKFKVHCPTFEITTTYRSWCFDLLNWEITKQKEKAKDIDKQLLDDTTRFTNSVSYLDSKCLLSIINKNTKKQMTNVDFRHNRKLAKLGIDLDKKINKNKVIFNLSDRTLTDEQTNILSLGLDYCMPLSSIKHTKFFLHFEKLCHTIKISPKR